MHCPIFGRSVRVVFPAALTECSSEEFFSVAGRICSDLRTRLTPDHLEEQSLSYYWKREEIDCADRRKDARLKSSLKFATLSIKMVFIPPIELPEDNEALEDYLI